MDYSETRKIPIGRSFAPKELSGKTEALDYRWAVFFIALHIPLGLLLYSSSIFALIHPLAVFALGVALAVQNKYSLQQVSYVAAYLVGSEVLWRMAGSAVFWEYGKYAVSIMMILALIQRGHIRMPRLPFIYFLFLLPASLITIINNSLADARGKLSFNLSGPLALFVCCWFFSYVKINLAEMKKLLLFITIPLISVGVTTLFFTVTTPDIQFTTESNFVSSGGFGPNQVSSMLGLGVFICLMCFIVFKNDFSHSVYLSVLAVFFAAQSMMTFSRGGIYAAIGASSVVALFQMRNLDSGVKKLIPVAALGVLFLVLVFPYLNNFTGGQLEERFKDSGTTNRAEIVMSDLGLFLQNPVLGTGVGESRTERQKITSFVSASHTEFSRIISEHGSFGIVSLIALAAAAFYNLKRQKSIFGRALAAGSLVWSGLFMLNAGMRLVVPSFLFGLSFVTILVPRSGKARRNHRFARELRFSGKKAVR